MKCLPSLTVACTLLLVLALPLNAQETTTEEVQDDSAGEAVSEETAGEEMAAEEMTAEETTDAVPVLMSAPWTASICDAWNETEELTGGLVKWMENDLDRGYKVIQIYRLDCEDSPHVELRMAPDDEGAVRCTYGGAIEDDSLDLDADYIMFAMTERWLEMGNGDYGPMKGMFTGRLKFKGPKWEAMHNMGPFTSFLVLTGSIDSDSETCPE